jgi:hypothetical protein
MRMLTVKLSSIYSFSSDSDEEKDKKRKQRAERFEKLNGIGVYLPKRPSDDDYEDSPTIAVTERQYIDLIQAGINVDNVLSVTDGGYDIDGAIQKVELLLSKVTKFADSIGNTEYNEKVEVYTPGAGLMLFNSVMLLSDACSDSLQTHIDEGWRIIAACPQPDQRRPDYILGRYDPTRDASVHGKGASRG